MQASELQAVNKSVARAQRDILRCAVSRIDISRAGRNVEAENEKEKERKREREIKNRNQKRKLPGARPGNDDRRSGEAQRREAERPIFEAEGRGKEGREGGRTNRGSKGPHLISG